MPSLPDPYTPGQTPRILAGRTVELGRIRDQLARVATFGELGGPLLVFHAPRGLGKTSLLREGQRHAIEAGFVTAWVACSRQQPFLPEVVRSIDRALQRADLDRDTRAGWRARLDKVSVELGLPGMKVTTGLARRDDPGQGAGQGTAATGGAGTGRASAPIAATEDLLHDAASLVRGRGGAGLVLFVDELHAAGADDLAVLLNAVQNLDGERERNPLAVVTAGLPVTPEAITRAATFGERSSFVPLDVLSETDARSAVIAPAESLGVTWDVVALDLVAAEARGHPYLLQLIGSATWATARPGAGATIGPGDVRRGAPRAREQLDAMYRARLNSASPGEQAFLRSMARARPDGSNVTRAQIAAGLGRTSQAISMPRERLIEKGVIEPVGHGLVRFTLPGFAGWLLEHDDDRDAP